MGQELQEKNKISYEGGVFLCNMCRLKEPILEIELNSEGLISRAFLENAKREGKKEGWRKP